MSWLKRKGLAVPETMDELYRTDPAAPGRLSVAEHLTHRGFASEHTETRFITEDLLNFLDGRAGGGWFAHVSYIRPHPPFSVPEPYASMYGPEHVLPAVRSQSRFRLIDQ